MFVGIELGGASAQASAWVAADKSAGRRRRRRRGAGVGASVGLWRSLALGRLVRLLGSFLGRGGRRRSSALLVAVLSEDLFELRLLDEKGLAATGVSIFAIVKDVPRLMERP